MNLATSGLVGKGSLLARWTMASSYAERFYPYVQLGAGLFNDLVGSTVGTKVAGSIGVGLNVAMLGVYVDYATTMHWHWVSFGVSYVKYLEEL